MNSFIVNTLAMWTPGPFELIVIGVIALLIFGKRLPEIARSLGKSLTEFKKGVSEAKHTKDELLNDVGEFKNYLVNKTNTIAPHSCFCTEKPHF